LVIRVEGQGSEGSNARPGKLPDNSHFTNRFAIKSETSDRLYKSGMAAAYYERCTERYLRTLYEELPTGWKCKCGAQFSTHDAPDHKCQITHPWLFTAPVLIPISWPTTATVEKK
jgi:hypothetical protein